jgi:short-subunit dehydrogenase
MQDKRIILTGAGGGIGGELARQLVDGGARLVLVDVNAQALAERQRELGEAQVHTVCVDITEPDAHARIVSECVERFGGIDILINSAGINPFGEFAQQPVELLGKTLEINTVAPILLTRAVLPVMLRQGSGQVVNVGSTFGSIGFAWFSAYSASKFALRGFSQALRRELADSDIAVTYVAPRAVRTTINSQQVYDMAQAVKMHFDEPEHVARRIIEAVRSRRKECYIGFPESLFVRINGLLPGLIDRALRRQNRRARDFAVRTG